MNRALPELVITFSIQSSPILILLPAFVRGWAPAISPLKVFLCHASEDKATIYFQEAHVPLWTDKGSSNRHNRICGADFAYVIVTLVGFLLLRRQIRQVDLSTRGETYGELYSQQHSITTFFIENLRLRPYFYDNREIDTDADYVQIMAVAEMVGDFLEHIYLQLPNLPSDVREGWAAYMGRIYCNSPALRIHFEANGSWYSEELVEMLRSKTMEER